MHTIKVDSKIRFFTHAQPYEIKGGRVYSLAFDRGGMFLFEKDAFSEPSNFFYEDSEKTFHDIILTDFKDSKFSCGVWLRGYKGQGKSVSAKTLAKRSGLPIVCINDRIPTGYDLIEFLNSIPKDYVLFIDEFEKIFQSAKTTEKTDDFYSENVFLSFLDGSNSNAVKKLVILTTNNDIGEFFINRPSRIKFVKTYNFLSEGFYNHLIDTLLDNKDYAEDLKKHVKVKDATVDILKSIIETINRVGIPYSQFKSFYNYRETEYSYTLFLYDEKARTFVFEKNFKSCDEIKNGFVVDEYYGTYILGTPYKEVQIIKIDNDSVIFSCEGNDLEDKKKKKTLIYKITKSGFQEEKKINIL